MSDAFHQVSLPISSLPPNTVKVFPTCAQVERTTKDVLIRPGRNKITIPNLTRYADEQSVKVEGTGDSAVITDISVEYINNATLWPEDDEDEEMLDPDSEMESDSEDNIAKLAGPEAVEFLQGIKDLRYKQKELIDELAAAHSRKNILDGFGGLISNNQGILTKNTSGQEPHLVLEKCLDTHAKKMSEIDRFIAEINKERAQIDKKIRLRERQKTAMLKEGNKQWRKKVEAKRRAREEKAMAFADKMAEKGPKFGAVHRVTIWIEGTSKVESSIGLKLSYIANNASWVPRYDINLVTHTAVPTATLTYRAHVTNQTGEAWTECTVILSTSQATFKGLQDHAPELEQWSIRLARSSDSDYWNLTKDGKEKVVLYSTQEKPGWYHSVQVQEGGNRFNARKGVGMFSKTSNMVQKKELASSAERRVSSPQVPNTRAVADYQMQLLVLEQQNKKRLLKARAEQLASSTNKEQAAPAMSRGGNAMAQAQAQQQQAVLGNMYMQQAQWAPGPVNEEYSATREEEEEDGFGGAAAGAPDDDDDGSSSDGDDASETATIASSAAKMRFATPSQSSTGLTTTYTLTSPLTIPSSALPRRHLIAEIDLNQVKLQHICIPKLRTAVFLKARIRNTSSTPLLRGSTGLTLDGSFLGSLTLPAAQPNEEFTLPLGVDTSVHVVYGKVQRKKALEKGIWNKESTTGFSRSITLQNGRQTPVSLLVIDQIPISEDEKIKVSIVTPKGLEMPTDEKKGNVVSTGVPLLSNSNTPVGSSSASLAKRMSIRGDKNSSHWGSAKAEMKKNGEVRWNVELRGGKGVGLGLDYQVGYPKEAGIINLN